VDFLSEAAQKTPAGDSNTFLSEANRKRRPGAGEYMPSDIQGFVNPVVDGEPDTSTYVPEEATSGEQSPPVYTKDEAMEIVKKRKPPADVLYPQGE
jgi:hypothetical protein